MHYYYVVDTLKHVRDNGHLLSSYEYCGTIQASVAYDRKGEHEVLVKVSFSDHGGMDAWEKLAFVHPLPHPLEDDELEDFHMHKLQRFHGHEHKPPANNPNGAPVWHHAGTDVPLARKPHTRKMMEQHVGKVFPNFRFRLFS